MKQENRSLSDEVGKKIIKMVSRSDTIMIKSNILIFIKKSLC